jgi:multiple sugar transport system permease protein
MLSFVLVGFIAQLFYSLDQGFINGAIGQQGTGPDWFGDPQLNLWAVLIAASWRHTGYIMVLYLAGLKSVDPSLRDAAKVDGAGEWQTFRSVIFPVLKPINVVVLVVTVIESLRAFDIVYVVNGGKNGLELLSVLIYDNIVGEASRIGYGSAIGSILLIIALGFIISYLVVNFRREQAR